jgi:anaerobic dimethyl sulfoxide reductase subunit A
MAHHADGGSGAGRRLVPVSCNRDCGGGCPLLAVIEDGRVVRLIDNPAGGPYMLGCVRGYEMARTLYAPDRLQRPLVRQGPRGSGEFREASWAEALDLVAGRLAEVRDHYGPTSVLHQGGSGACRGALHHTGRLAQRFLAMYGGATVTTGGYSSAAVRFTLPYVVGTFDAGQDPGSLAYSNLILLWGANIADCRYSSELYSVLREARARGVEVIVIDPRRSRTLDELGTRWLALRPGTDAALMLAVLHVLLAEDLVDRPYVAAYSTGFDELAAYVRGETDGQAKTPEWAETICGTPAQEIRDLARLYGRTHPTGLVPGYAIQRTIGGEEAVRLAVALQVATGNLGVRGGSAGSRGWDGLPGPRMGLIPVPSMPAGAAVPVYRWPDAVLEGTGGGYPSDIHAIYNVGGNFLAQGSDVAKNIRAFQSVDFAVTHDLFLTPTARYCDVVLPVTHFLERADIITAAGNVVYYSHKVAEPCGEARDDYAIFCDLAERLGFGPAYSEGRDAAAWLAHCLDGSEVTDRAAFRASGIYLGRDRARTAFSDFIADPAAHPLATPSGRVELVSAAYEADTGFPALPMPRVLPPTPDHPLRLITPKSRFRVHSQHFNIAWYNAHEPQALWIHPLDAAARGIADGQVVQVSSPQGTVRIAARVTADILPGVVCLLEGAWPTWAEDGAEVAGCANILTSTEPTLPSEGSRTHSVHVQVR